MNSVIIENPAFSGSRYTSLKAADRYVRRGRARWTVPGKRLRFIEEDHRHVSAAEQALLRNRGYDARGLLTLTEVANLPCVRPVVLITMSQRTRVAPPIRHGKVVTRMRGGVPAAA